MTTPRYFRRSLLPAGVFIVVLIVHYLWLGFFPEQQAVQSKWVSFGNQFDVSWWRLYTESESYFLGFSYALSLAFAAFALRQYREQRLCRARNLAVGGITLTGFLAVAGCYLLGCCGSPMLAVYLSMFGAAFLPFAKPLVAGLTTIMIIIAWWWLNHSAFDLRSKRSQIPWMKTQNAVNWLGV